MNDLPLDLDLNLLRTLDVLLETRSVTRAAGRLGRSQPAVSHALGRLREVLQDPLLVREGSHLMPTPRALELAEPLRRGLIDLGHTLSLGRDFDPSQTKRTFLIACPDALAPLLPDVLDALGGAPGLKVELLTLRGPEALENAHLCLDVLPESAPGIVARALGRTTQTVTMRAGHPALKEPWNLDAYTTWPHVTVRTGSGRPSLVENALRSAGRTRRVGLVVQNLLLAPHIAARSDLLFTGARELLAPLADSLGLQFREPPVPIPGAPTAAMWRSRYTKDPAHRWMREQIISVLKERFSR